MCYHWLHDRLHHNLSWLIILLVGGTKAGNLNVVIPIKHFTNGMLTRAFWSMNLVQKIYNAYHIIFFPAPPFMGANRAFCALFFRFYNHYQVCYTLRSILQKNTRIDDVSRICATLSQSPILFFGGWWWMLSTWAVGATPSSLVVTSESDLPSV